MTQQNTFVTDGNSFLESVMAERRKVASALLVSQKKLDTAKRTGMAFIERWQENFPRRTSVIYLARNTDISHTAIRWRVSSKNKELARRRMDFSSPLMLKLLRRLPTTVALLVMQFDLERVQLNLDIATLSFQVKRQRLMLEQIEAIENVLTQTLKLE